MMKALRSAELSAPEFRRKSHLLHESTDAWLAGLLSMVFFALYFVLRDKADPTFSLGWAAFYLGYLINWPHFAMSYQLLYGHAPSEYKKPRFIWAAIVVPALLVGTLAYIYKTANLTLMAYAVNTMFFFVGWHYVKQTFGITLLFCNLKSYRLDPLFKNALKFNLLFLWILNWALANISSTEYDFYSFKYFQLGFPEELRSPFLWAFGASVFSLVALTFRTYVNWGKWPPLGALATWGTMVLWYIPSLYHPAFFIFIPFFHSLQYILCVGAYRRTKVDKDIANVGDERQYRIQALKRHLGFFLLAGLLGTLAFETVPRFLDAQATTSYFDGKTFYIAAFTLFINIHHYFIDNVIWKRDFGNLQFHLNFERDTTAVKEKHHVA